MSADYCHQTLAGGMKPECEFSDRMDFSSWQAKARAGLARRLGLDRMMSAERVPLNAKSLWRRTVAGGSIEKISFVSEPGFETFAYLCTPQGKGPHPFFICLQGHSTGMHTSIAVDWRDETQSIPIEGDRDFGIKCLELGIGALCLEQRAFGEHSTHPDHEPACLVPAEHALLLGRTLLGERIYDIDRAIDYLYTRDDVRHDAIGVMGNSGGGTASMFAGGLLDRITHVMPSCSFSSFRDSIFAMNHCVCNYVPDLLGYGETADVVGLAAPKPIVIVNGDADKIFPIKAANHEFERLCSIYQSAGAPENCIHVIGQGGHRFYADLAWTAMLDFLPRA